jgi:hypothetical protein
MKAMTVGLHSTAILVLILALGVGTLSCTAQSREQSPHVEMALTPVAVEGQPLSANIQRAVEALDYLGAPLPVDLRSDLTVAGRASDATRLQELLDARVLLVVHINPEARVCRSLARGRSYVSDGYAHGLAFDVNGKTSGDELDLATSGRVTVTGKVAFSRETPLEPAYGDAIPVGAIAGGDRRPIPIAFRPRLATATW